MATNDELRAGARNTEPPYRVGVELLIWLGKNLPTVTDGGLSGADVRVDTELLRDWSGVWSGGERRIVGVALSLMVGDPVDLSDVIGGLGGAHRRAALEAIAAAAGFHLAP